RGCARRWPGIAGDGLEPHARRRPRAALRRAARGAVAAVVRVGGGPAASRRDARSPGARRGPQLRGALRDPADPGADGAVGGRAEWHLHRCAGSLGGREPRAGGVRLAPTTGRPPPHVGVEPAMTPEAAFRAANTLALVSWVLLATRPRAA